MSRPEFLTLVSVSYIANGMPPIVAIAFGAVFALWALWEARRP